MNVGLLCESAMKYQEPLKSLFSFSFLYVLLKRNQNIRLIKMRNVKITWCKVHHILSYSVTRVLLRPILSGTVNQHFVQFLSLFILISWLRWKFAFEIMNTYTLFMVLLLQVSTFYRGLKWLNSLYVQHQILTGVHLKWWIPILCSSYLSRFPHSIYRSQMTGYFVSAPFFICPCLMT